VVKVIGWDRDEQGYSYWIIENSWGESWGMKGLAYIGQRGYLNLAEACISIIL
jgi:cathepsin B